MGVVWQAWDTRLRRPVALKMLRPQPSLGEDERQVATDRAMREARNAAGLHHPHAVTVFDVVEHEGQPCIVMQLIESTPLSDLLREHGTLSPLETARIGAEVASALATAHDLKIVHRDVKPGNILIAGDGSALISDFGISHALGDTTITATGLIHGTPAYLAPEVARGLPTSFASDVFSLGSTLYSMLEGAPPFGTERNPIALLHRVARGGYPPPKHAGPLASPLRSMLAAQPKPRPTMRAVAEMLTALQRGETRPDLSADLRTLGFLAADVAGGPDGNVSETTRYDVRTPETIALEEDAATALTVDLGDDETARRAADPETVRLDETVSGDTASPTPEVRSAPSPVGRTLPMDQPARYQPPTAETEPLSRAAPSAPRPVGSAPSWLAQPPTLEAAPGRTGRRRVGIVAGAVLLAALAALAALIAVVLVLDLAPGVAPRAEPGPEPTATTSAAGQGPRPTSGTPAPTSAATTPPAAEPAPAPPPVSPEQRVVDTITGYYAMLPDDRDAAWPLMTADYQENHAGGRGGYEAFWSQVAQVSVSQVSAAGPDRGQATLTYHFRDGRVVEEVTAYRFLDDGGVLKVAATEVLSSREL